MYIDKRQTFYTTVKWRVWRYQRVNQNP